MSTTEIKQNVVFLVKKACFDPQLHPQVSSNIWRFWYQKFSHILKTLGVKWHALSLCYVGEISTRTSSWKLEKHSYHYNNKQ